MRLPDSFANAFHGLRDCILHEKNFRIQYFIAILIAIAGAFFRISAMEWMVLTLCFSVVLGFEIMNSSIEKLCDLVCPDYNLVIKKVKDMAASAVLLAAIFSL